MPHPSHPRDRQIRSEGFKHGYAGFVTRAGSDATYAIGYKCGRILRDSHLQEAEQVLRNGGLGPDDLEQTA